MTNVEETITKIMRGEERSRNDIDYVIDDSGETYIFADVEESEDYKAFSCFVDVYKENDFGHPYGVIIGERMLENGYYCKQDWEYSAPYCDSLTYYTKDCFNVKNCECEYDSDLLVEIIKDKEGIDCDMVDLHTYEYRFENAAEIIGLIGIF